MRLLVYPLPNKVDSYSCEPTSNLKRRRVLALGNSALVLEFPLLVRMMDFSNYEIRPDFLWITSEVISVEKISGLQLGVFEVSLELCKKTRDSFNYISWHSAATNTRPLLSL